jgi:hypothetical protein
MREHKKKRGNMFQGFSKATRMFEMFSHVIYFRHIASPKLFELFSTCQEVLSLSVVC